jgi:hypothetical protein
MEILLKLRRHEGVTATEHLGAHGRSVVYLHRRRREVGGPVPRPEFGGPSAIARLAAGMLVARLTGDEVVAPRGMRPDDIGAAFRLMESVFADLARAGLLSTDDRAAGRETHG